METREAGKMASGQGGAQYDDTVSLASAAGPGVEVGAVSAGATTSGASASPGAASASGTGAGDVAVSLPGSSSAPYDNSEFRRLEAGTLDPIARPIATDAAAAAVAAKGAAGAAGGTPPQTPQTPSNQSAGGLTGLLARLEARGWLEGISPKHSIRHTLLVLFCTGLCSGLLGGMFGTGGPPQMIAFALLHINKDDIRGVSSVYMVLEMTVRVIVNTTAEGNVFDSSEWRVYVFIAVASWVGFVIGTYLRRFADTNAIIRLLLALVFASSAILLGALEDPGVAAFFVVWSLFWFLLLAALYLRPPVMVALLERLKEWRYTVGPLSRQWWAERLRKLTGSDRRAPGGSASGGVAQMRESAMGGV
jgi:uncharacterized membrane protein YfcA